MVKFKILILSLIFSISVFSQNSFFFKTVEEKSNSHTSEPDLKKASFFLDKKIGIQL